MNGDSVGLVALDLVGASIGKIGAGETILLMGTIAEWLVRRATTPAKCHHRLGFNTLPAPVSEIFEVSDQIRTIRLAFDRGSFAHLEFLSLLLHCNSLTV